MIKSFEQHSADATLVVSPAPAERPQAPPLHQNEERSETRRKIHAAIIMDGSGRWAEERGLARSAGHRAGVAAVRRAVQAAPGLGIGTLTLHAFSSDNWRRPAREVRELMLIFEDFLRSSVAEWVDAGIRVSVFGRRDRLDPSLTAAIDAAEVATRGGRRLHLRLAIDYSARTAILRAARALAHSGAATPAEFARLLAARDHHRAPAGSALVRNVAPGLVPVHTAATGGPPFDSGSYAPVPELDLLIRTGGEQRLSDFMLWECAYAELVFTDRRWPDFDAADLEAAIREFHSRHRRFGRIQESVHAAEYHR
jgi:undecaprenyl diphosphate synthase